MRTDRAPNALRPLTVTPGVNSYAEGSALVQWGNTRVQATVSVESRLPPHLRGTNAKSGWLTAEYALLPRSTRERSPRERVYTGGRTHEIQRLLGRSLRAITRLEMFRNQTLTIDVDVLQADGGTRCAGIVAAYAAMHELSNRLVYSGKLDEWPLTHELAAVSVGIVDGGMHLDLDEAEDQRCSADLNVVATEGGHIVEVQGGGEEEPMPVGTYLELVDVGVNAVKEIVEQVRPQLAQARA